MGSRNHGCDPEGGTAMGKLRTRLHEAVTSTKLNKEKYPEPPVVSGDYGLSSASSISGSLWEPVSEASQSRIVVGDEHHVTPLREIGEATTKVEDEEATEGEDEEDLKVYPTGLKLFVINVALDLACICVALDSSILGTAIPQITVDFNSSSDIGWYGSAYTLTTCCFQLMFGKLYATLDIKWVFLTAVIIFEVGSVICAAAPSSIALILGRAIAGLGCSGIFSGAVLIIAMSVHISERPKYTGILGACAAVAQVIAPFLGGVFTSKLSWRWCFWINLPFGGVTIIVLLFLVRLPRQSGSGPPKPIREILKTFDWLGTCSLFSAIICLLLVLQWGGISYPWRSWRIILLLCIFGVMTVCWTFIQWRLEDRATVPRRIIQNRSIAGALWVMFCLTGCMYTAAQYIPIWFQVAQDDSPYQSGVNFLPATASMVVASLASGYLTTLIGYYNPIIYFAVIVMAAAGGMIYHFGVDTPTSYWVGSLVVYGFGAGMATQPPLMVPQNVLRGSDLPIGTSLVVFSQSLSGTIFQSVGNNLLNGQVVSALEARVPQVDPDVVLRAGVGHLASSMQRLYPQYVSQIIEAYAQALRQVFLVLLILTCLSIIGGAAIEWKSVKRAKSKGAGVATEMISV